MIDAYIMISDEKHGVKDLFALAQKEGSGVRALKFTPAVPASTIADALHGIADSIMARGERGKHVVLFIDEGTARK